MQINRPLMDNTSEIPADVIKHTFATSSFGTIYNGHKLWIGCETAMCFLTVFLGYIICCEARYGWTLVRNCKDIRASGAPAASNDGTREHSGRRSCVGVSAVSRNKYKIIMIYLCLFASVVTMVKFIIDQVKFFYAWKARDDEVCEILYDVADNALFFVAYLSVYGFLWMKQWLFYRDPAVVGILYNKKLVLFSKIFGPVVLLLGVVNVTINIIPIRFKAGFSHADANDPISLLNDQTYLGCVSTYKYTDSDQVWPLMSYAVITTIFQCILLGLFSYPLFRQKLDLMRLRKSQRKHGRDTTPPMNPHRKGFLELPFWKTKKKLFQDDGGEGSTLSSDASTTQPDSVQKQYQTKMYTPSVDAVRPIKRAVFWTFVCIATDGGLFIVFACLGEGTPLILITLAQDIDILFNILCLLATYNTWQYIVFPLCKTENVTAEDMNAAATSFMKIADSHETV